MVAAPVWHHGVVLTIAVSGPQGSGQMTLAMALGSSLGMPVFSRDPLMAVLLRSGLPRPTQDGIADSMQPVDGLVTAQPGQQLTSRLERRAGCRRLAE
jgi:hypothetical protein